MNGDVVEMYICTPACMAGTQTGIGYLSIYQSLISVRIKGSTLQTGCMTVEEKAVLKGKFAYNIKFFGKLTFRCSSDRRRLSGMSLKSEMERRRRRREGGKRQGRILSIFGVIHSK